MSRTKEQQAAYDKIGQLVEHFSTQIEVFKKNQNETETRNQFINPLFDALGWDIDNTKRRAIDSDRDVVHEDRLKIEGKSKAPDYSFRIGGKRKFFLEAKKPLIQIKTDIIPSYQLRRYGWNDTEVNISILTDFEEFALYDCTMQPKATDAATVGRLKYVTYDQYLKEFDWLWDLLSKDQVVKGSLAQFAKSVKKGTQSVDAAFLQSLDNWRKYLATSIALRNKDLNEDEINYIVQMNINRIVFIRNCEDRGAEPYGKLKSCLVNPKDEGGCFRNMYQIFEDADRKYNSGLFDFTKDNLSKSVIIDNDVVNTIVEELYYPKSPYEFSVIGVEILGTAYERFLGKVIRLTPDHQAIVEEKPEVRKAGGVFYTPQYVVEYIVKQTVGKLIDGKTPDEIAKIKICDPACGSGSFLLGAYQYLLSYHTDWHIKNYKKTRNAKDSPLTPDGRLTTHVKKQILLNNIFGVDIDTQAVEVTKLSLLMKCMEGETTASMQTTMTFERVLPTLDNNIKSGNSLIDFDFYESQLDFGEEKKIKPFNWKQAFAQVFKQGGFDIVVGNPPYLGGREWKEDNGNAYEYFISKYKVAEYQFDIYALFWEAGIKLLRPNGAISFITPNTWLNNQSNTKLRTYILNNTTISTIADFSKIKVFDQATVLPIITILKNKINEESITEVFEPFDDRFVLTQSVNQKIWNDGDLNIININLSQNDLLLRNKIEKDTQPLEKLAQIKFGIKVYQTGKGRPKQTPDAAENKIFESKQQLSSEYLPYLKGKDINKYNYKWNGDWLHYGAHLAEPRTIDLFTGERLLVRRIVGETLIATYIKDDLVTGQLLQIVKPNLPDNSKFLLGILNSKLMAYYFIKKYNRQDKTFPEIRIYELSSLPIKKIDISNEYVKSNLDEMVKNVELLLKLNTDLQTEASATKREQAQGRIAYAEQTINEIVYQLYDLTPDEIKIVEGQS